MQSTKQLLSRRQQLLQSLSQYPGILNGSFFERELNGKARLYLSRMVNGTQRQTYIAQKHRTAVERALRQYRGLQRTVEQLCEIVTTQVPTHEILGLAFGRVQELDTWH